MQRTQSGINTDNAYDWLKHANLVNKKEVPITYHFLKENADVICLLFNQYRCDRCGVIRKFYTIYENSKFFNIPIEVIYIPLDETEADFRKSLKEQANWFTLKYNDPLIHELKYMYEVTCLPQLRILSVDATLISRDGIGDIEQYGQNAVITWLPTSASSKKHRNFKNETFYANKWKYINVHRGDSGEGKEAKARNWSLSDVDETSSPKARVSDDSSKSVDDQINGLDSDDDDEEKPFYDSTKF